MTVRRSITKDQPGRWAVEAIHDVNSETSPSALLMRLIGDTQAEEAASLAGIFPSFGRPLEVLCPCWLICASGAKGVRNGDSPAGSRSAGTREGSPTAGLTGSDAV